MVGTVAIASKGVEPLNCRKQCAFKIIRYHDPSGDRSQVELPFEFKQSERGPLVGSALTLQTRKSLTVDI